jgi:hypothetical protein
VVNCKNFTQKHVKVVLQKLPLLTDRKVKSFLLLRRSGTVLLNFPLENPCYKKDFRTIPAHNVLSYLKDGFLFSNQA